MIRLIKNLLSGFDNPGYLISSLPSLLLLGFSVVIAVYVAKRFKGSASNLVAIGVAINVVSFLFNQYIFNFLLSDMGGSEINNYFVVNSVISFVGQFLFLLGIFQLFKHFYNSSEKSFPGY